MNPPALETQDSQTARPPKNAGKPRVARSEPSLRIAHVLRKYNPAEWGGTETALQRLFTGLRSHDVESVAFCPRIDNPSVPDPLAETGCVIRRFHSFLPVLGIPHSDRQQRIAVGGNLMSFELPFALWHEPDVSVIHTHALGRLGGVAALVARWRSLPLVVTIHGGYLDLPEMVRESFAKPGGAWEWGKIFGFMLRSRQLLRFADAILTCNPREAALLREKFPDRHIIVQPHGVSLERYRQDCRRRAHEAFPLTQDRDILLCVGRIDAVKNPGWVVEQMPMVFHRHPNALLVLAGACTDEAYGEVLRTRVHELGLANRVLFTGGLPPGDARLIGLFQSARVVLLSSISETFGLVILEAWAAGTAVIASRTSGARALIREGANGWLFDHNDARAFQKAIAVALGNPDIAARYAAEGTRLVAAEYDNAVLTARMKDLYAQLVSEKNTLRHRAR